MLQGEVGSAKKKSYVGIYLQELRDTGTVAFECWPVDLHAELRVCVLYFGVLCIVYLKIQHETELRGCI